MISWIIILAAMLFIYGSFLMLKPNPRDARLAQLRLQAAQAGLHLRQYKWQSDPKKTGIYDSLFSTSYTLMRPEHNKPGELLYSIVKQKGWDTEHLPQGYAWHKIGTEEQAQHFNQQLEKLNDELLLIEVWENKISIMPKEETHASIENYQEFMRSFLS